MILKKHVPIAEHPIKDEPFHECYFRSPCYQGTHIEVPIKVDGEVTVVPCIKLDEKDRLQQWLKNVGAHTYEHNSTLSHMLATRLSQGGLCELLCEWIPAEDAISDGHPYHVIIRARTPPNTPLPMCVATMLKENGYQHISEDNEAVRSLQEIL